MLILPSTREGLQRQLQAVKETGNTPVLSSDSDIAALIEGMEPALTKGIEWISDWTDDPSYMHVLIEADGQDILPTLRIIAANDGRIPIIQLGGGGRNYRTDWMFEEVAISVDTTAAGGNASLMAVA